MHQKWMLDALREQRLLVRMQLQLDSSRTTRPNVKGRFFTGKNFEGSLVIGCVDYTYSAINGACRVSCSLADNSDPASHSRWASHQTTRLEGILHWREEVGEACFYDYLTGPKCGLKLSEDEYLRTHLIRAQALIRGYPVGADLRQGVLLGAVAHRLDGLVHELVPMPRYPHHC